MIRVLIAEDEPPTARRLKRLIETTDPAFAVVATAIDGGQALELLREMPVDIVFTDIRMPVMDGLRLMDEVARGWPDVLVVVVSGFQDFAYVSHAIRTHAVDYLLKPVPQEAMAQLLQRLLTLWEDRRHERMTRRLSAQINRAAPRPAREADGADDVRLGVCLFCAGALPLGEDAEMSPGAAAMGDASLETLAREMPGSKANFTWEFMGNTPVERILIYRAEGADVEGWARALHERAALAVSMPVSCACLKEAVLLPQVGGMLRKLRRCLRRHMCIGQGLFFSVGPAEDMEGAAPPIDRDLALQVAALLLGDSTSDAQGVFARLREARYTQERMHRLLMEAVSLLEADRLTPAEGTQYREVLTDLICTALSMDELTGGLLGLAPAKEGPSLAQTERLAMLRGIEKYLRDNYRGHVNNQTLASTFGYVPSYISMLFRQAYGVSPGEYLTRVRIDEAKRLMRRHPEMLIREVAEHVGFKSQHHFSRTFKKNEGVWPTRFTPDRRDAAE